MTISKDLFLAILSMDAYNREYSAGIDIVGSSLGFAQLVNRESLGIDASAYQDWQDAGFYAVAYKMASGEEIAGLSVGDTIISYRGTDNPDPLTWEDGASDVCRAGLPAREFLAPSLYWHWTATVLAGLGVPPTSLNISGYV